ncbi:MAG: RNase adapter RapZ [Magnetospirillum sp.]|nr:RNase adapter RapZ [Magnetospirillum sp.]
MTDDTPPDAGSAAVARAAASASTATAGRVIIVTGMSGAGKTLTLKALEDHGWEAVDNLPLSLLSSLVRPGEGAGRRLAIGIDIRTRDFGVERVAAAIDRLMTESGLDVRLLFLDCDDDVLCRRFTETRRRHPLAADRPLLDGIRHERELVSPLRARAEVIDTSQTATGDFKRMLAGRLGLEAERDLVLFVTSFAYRNGLPREADLVLDARFLRNPHYVPELKALTGRDQGVADYVSADPAFAGFIRSVTELLSPLLPRFAAEGKSYLTLAVGCTGGRHRSVLVAERLARWLRDRGCRVELRHRELDQGGT